MRFEKVIDLLHTAKKSGIGVFLKEDKLQLRMPKDTIIDPQLLADIKESKKEIIEYLGDSRWKLKTEDAKITPIDRNKVQRIPLSFEQESLWFIDRLQGSVQFHMPGVFRLTGDLDLSALENSLRTIISRHQVLRTVIEEHDGVGYQKICDADEWRLQYVPQDETRAKGMDTREYIEELISRPFDLSKDLMLRVTLIEVSHQNHILVAIMHHIAADGWSLSIVVRELAELYRSYVEHRPPALEELPIQYADYAMWQRTYLSGSVLETKLKYWKEHLNGVEPIVLPVDYRRPSGQSIRGGVVNKFVDKEICDALMSLSRKEGTTLFMALLAIFNVLLHRYSGQDDICIGSPTAGRQTEAVEGLVGFFLNAIALRSNLRDDPSFHHLLQQIRQTTLDAYEHQDVPFEKIVKALDIERDANINPVFQVRFALQNAPAAGSLDLNGVNLEEIAYDQVTVQIDLNLIIKESPEGLYISLYYCSDLYKEETIRRMLEHYANLMRAVIEDSNTKISQLKMLSAADEMQLLQEFNNTQTDYPSDRTVIALFREQAILTPHATATMSEGNILTYRSLDERSDQLAEYLRRIGVRKGTIVPVCMKRSPEILDRKSVV